MNPEKNSLKKYCSTIWHNHPLFKEMALLRNKKKAPCLVGVPKTAWPHLIETFIKKYYQPSAKAPLAAKTFSKRLWIITSSVKEQRYFFEQALYYLPQLQLLEKLPELLEEEEDESLALLNSSLIAKRIEILGKLSQNETKNGNHSTQEPQQILITIDDILSCVPAPEELQAGLQEYQVGWQGDPLDLVTELQTAGLQPAPQVIHRGDYSLRGGLVDFFSWQAEFPCRVEFDEEGIESLRLFDVDSQITFTQLKPLDSYQLQTSPSLPHPSENFIEQEKNSDHRLYDYFSANDDFLMVGENFDLEVKKLLCHLPHRPTLLIEGSTLPPWTTPSQYQLIEGNAFILETAQFRSGDFLLEEKQRQAFFTQIREWQQAGWQLLLITNNEALLERFLDLVEPEGLPPESFEWEAGQITHSYYLSQEKIAILGLNEIFGQSQTDPSLLDEQKKESQKLGLLGRNPLHFKEFEPGDLVVHPDYGIAYYQGIERVQSPNTPAREVLALEFAEQARLLIPLEEAWKISRYIGIGKASPTPSSLDNKAWKKTKEAAQKSIFLYAGKLLKLQVERETESGYSFPADTPWQRTFEESFPYQETADQLSAIRAIKHDMESALPMDRLLCGDVGFGKTEVALRAAFKAVMGGKQVAFLAPTTVLTQQHYQTLQERMSPYPITIELINRYRSKKEQTEILKKLSEGSIDIIVGTHRLFSKDIAFNDLGLVIIDEEQRFGVKHKEAFKERYRKVDILTLSATPIPRTLYFSLMGTRPMSQLQTPPAGRQAVTTIITPYDERVIQRAIAEELERGGQIYFLHNRVMSIDKVATKIAQFFPEATIALGHGQMAEGELEKIMEQFVSGRADILVATTIIESGLDIPNANTIIIDRADLFGLADLYQLRGRVGRSHHKAYAYLMLPGDRLLLGEAHRRVRAMKQYDQLGAGFKIAMRDLEIRGAGNLLGTAQSGHATAIGFDLYCHMLQHALELHYEDQKQPPPTYYQESQESYLHLDFVITSDEEWTTAEQQRLEREKRECTSFKPLVLPAFLPSDFFEEPTLKMQLYQELADSMASLDQLKARWENRFGQLPLPIQHLITFTKIRHLATQRQVRRVETKGKKLMLERKGSWILLNHQFPQLTAWKPEDKLKEVIHFLEEIKLHT